jgi:hypothetical protein
MATVHICQITDLSAMTNFSFSVARSEGARLDGLLPKYLRRREALLDVRLRVRTNSGV